MQYDVKHICGHVEKVTLFGPERDRQRRLEYLKSSMCPQCLAAHRKAEADKLAEQAQADGFPKLTGTEKQIIWAEQIRARSVDWIVETRTHAEQYIADAVPSDQVHLREQYDSWNRAADYILETETSASFWIDHRDSVAEAIEQLANKMESVEIDVLEETTVYPEQQTHGIAEILLLDDDVVVKYPRDEDFRSAVKEAGFSWSSDHKVWHKKITQFTGSAVDRASEVGNILLRAGFAIRCQNDHVRQLSTTGNFEPECKKWVCKRSLGDYKGWLAILIPYRDQDMYNNAKRIPDSRWSLGNIVVPINKYQLVLDFADLFGYKISKGAQEEIARYKESRMHAVTPATPIKPIQVDRLQEILDSDDSVIDDLKDE